MSLWTLFVKIKIYEICLDFVTKYAYYLHEIIFNIFVTKFLRSYVPLFN